MIICNNYWQILTGLDRPYLKITIGQLCHLFEILKGDPDPISKGQLTKEALKQLELMEQKMQDAKVQQINYLRTGEMAHQSRALTGFPKVLSSITSNHMV